MNSGDVSFENESFQIFSVRADQKTFIFKRQTTFLLEFFHWNTPVNKTKTKTKTKRERE